MTTTPSQPKQKSGRVLIVAEPTELELDGRKIKAFALEMPNGQRKLFTEQSGVALVEWLTEQVFDPSMPKAEIVPKTSVVDVIREGLHMLNGSQPAKG